MYLLPAKTPAHIDEFTNRVTCGDALATLQRMPSESVHCIVTSPPYFGLRDYGVAGQIGLEETPRQYVDKLTALFREARRVLRADGVMFLNLGDSYASGEVGRHDKITPGSNVGNDSKYQGIDRQQSKLTTGLPPKNLLGIPWRVAFALQDDGWILRSDIIWAKPNPMPESVTDRPTKAHEYVFLMSKNARYWYDADAIREPAQDRPFAGSEAKTIKPNDTHWLDNRYAPGASGYGHNPDGRNKRSVWTIATQPQSFSNLLADYEGDDGKPYIASPNCAIHGHLADSEKWQKLGYDERQVEMLPRNTGMSNHPASKHNGEPLATKPHTSQKLPPSMPDYQSQQNALLQTPDSTDVSKNGVAHLVHSYSAEMTFDTSHIQEHDADVDDSLNLPLFAHSPIAIEHNSQIRKKGRALATNQPCNSSGETLSHTDGKSIQLVNNERGDHTHENNNAEDFSQDDSHSGLLVEKVSRTVDNLEFPSIITSREDYTCLCVQCTDHFATFPEKLIEPMILAGCPVGGIVLDPFFGSGTTGLVARRLGRKFAGIELNPAYVAIAERRLSVPYTLPMFETLALEA